MEYSIREFAEMAGTTSRALRHYDQLGLLPPVRIAHNGYRYYDDQSALQLQKILLLKNMGMPLEDIKHALSPENDALALLATLREQLVSEHLVIARRIQTVSQTISALSKGATMNAHDALQGFNEQYKAEVIERWGKEAFRQSHDWWTKLTSDAQKEFKADVETINKNWIQVWQSGMRPDSESAQEMAFQHAQWLASIPGTPSSTGNKEAVKDYIESLAHMYPADPRFAANYGGEEGAKFVRDALLHFIRTDTK